MEFDDLVLVSVDDHIVEPPDLFEGMLSAKYQDKAPHAVTRADGAHVWMYEGAEMEVIALNAVVGRPPEEYGVEPQSFDELRPGTYDVHERVKDMSANGEWAAVNFPSFIGLAGPLFSRFARTDADQAVAMIQAYNNWHIDVWCGAYPDRFIPLGILPLWDVDVMIAELHRLADKGCRAVTVPGVPWPYPSYFTDHWDPFWAECQDAGIVPCMHLGSGGSFMKLKGIDDGYEESLPPRPEPSMGLGQAGIGAMPGTPPAVAADLVNSHIFERFPRLRVSLSEGGIGWIPYFLEWADFRYRHHGAWTHTNYGGQMPSDTFKEHVLCCFIEDGAGLAARKYLNTDMIAWECDYPHSDCTWPWSPEELHKQFDGLSDVEIDKITHQNVARLFEFDLFANRTREQCTVAALRAEVAGHDVTIRAKGLSGRKSAAWDGMLAATAAKPASTSSVT